MNWLRQIFGLDGVRSARPPIVPAQSGHTRQLRASEAYTPTQPRTTRSALTGRQQELATITQGLTEDRSHVVLYSERGRGKTSLANVAVEALRRSGTIVVRTQCESASTFDSVMRGLLSDLPATFLKTLPSDGNSASCESALPQGPVRPDDMIAALGKLRTRSLVCVIDEFDRVQDSASRTMLADTIKQASDRTLSLLFLIIGVSDSLEQLIGQHPSIQRNILSVPLPLLSDENIAALIQTGAQEAQFRFPPALVAKVTDISRGMPYVAHLLGRRIAQATGQRGSRAVDERDFATAIERLIQETPPSVVQHYDELTSDGCDAEAILGLNAAARCKQDSWGRIVVIPQANGTMLLGGTRLSGPCWSRLQATGVLRPCAGKSGHLAYADRALIQYALLRASLQQPAEAASPARAVMPTDRAAALTGSDLQSP